jgi:DNA-binding HxlR family transcriptional regulator
VSEPAVPIGRRPALYAVPARPDDSWASASDREMIEATAVAVGLFAAKWKVDLLFLLAAGVRRHSRLLDHLLISKKVLSDALKSLERDGLVHRRVFPETPVRVEYSLTPLGRSLTAPLFALWEWAHEHIEAVQAARCEFDLRNGAVTEVGDALPRFSAAFQVRSELAS